MPSIYVACLASYNAGRLHGAWIEIEDGNTIEDLHEGIATMLKASPAPDADEWAIHDYEDFGNLARDLGEHPDLERVLLHATMLDKHEEAWEDYVSHVGEHYATEDHFDDSYRGYWPNPGDYAKDFTEQCCDIPSYLEYYIDYEKMELDMQYGGDIYRFDTGHVFDA